MFSYEKILSSAGETATNQKDIDMYDFTYLNDLSFDELEGVYRWAHWRDDAQCKALAAECQTRMTELAA